MIVNITLEREDFDAMHDVILETLNLESEITDSVIQKIWDMTPEHIKGTAIEWGTDDTVFRDNLYEWLQENSKSIEI
jgi:hypothetical protein